MMRYIWLNAGFTCLALGVLYLRRQQLTAHWRQAGLILLGLLALTAVFDNVIIMLHIVGYHAEYLSGLYVYKAPIEDFAYTLVALILVIALWEQEPS